jgi:hypothetical protein
MVHEKGDNMRTVRVLIAWVLVVGLSTPALAGDLLSITKLADQQEGAQKPRIEKKYAVLGGAIFAGGMALAVYGFLHTKGGEFVSGEVSKESKTQLGGAGLAIAGAGGAVLFLGSQRSKRSASLTVGAGRIALSKQVSW